MKYTCHSLVLKMAAFIGMAVLGIMIFEFMMKNHLKNASMMNQIPEMTLNQTQNQNQNDMKVVKPWKAIFNTKELLDMKTGKPEYLRNYKNPCWNDTSGLKGWKVRCLPYFLLAGFEKCGTTDLWYMITGHPQIARPYDKEPNWWAIRRFGAKQHPTKPCSTIYCYVDYFSNASKVIDANWKNVNGQHYHSMITGDGTPSTIWFNLRWHRMADNDPSLSEPEIITADVIHHVIPMARVVVTMRNPTERLYSDYVFWLRIHSLQPSPEDFHKQCKISIKIMTECLTTHSQRYCVYSLRKISKATVRLHIGMYSVFIKDWLKVFPRKNIHFLKLENYAQNRTRELFKVFDFLGIERVQYTDFEDVPRRNIGLKSRNKIGDMMNKTRKIIDRFYKPFNDDLVRVLEDNQFMFNRQNSA